MNKNILERGEILYTVFAPLSGPLSRSRWTYYQFADGTAAKTITIKSGFESAPDNLHLCDVFPDALSWARCLCSGKPKFEDCPAANEIYNTLCNASMHATNGNLYIAKICCEGMIDDLQEWIRQLNSEDKTTKEAA